MIGLKNLHVKKTILVCLLTLIILPDIASSEETYRFERLWPTLKQPWYFKDPGMLVVSDNNIVFVADASNNRIVKLTADGLFITAWGTEGTGNGQLL